MYNPALSLQYQPSAQHISYHISVPSPFPVSTPSTIYTMPLVVPGIQSNDKDLTTQWMNKLMGKKLGDSHDEVVSSPSGVLLVRSSNSG
jgi:hypothetical protein